jgi:hypothetical protein
MTPSSDLDRTDLTSAPRFMRQPLCGGFAEPSDGLEPSTPSLPSTHGKGFLLFEPFPSPSHLRAIATGCARSALSEEGLGVKWSAG